MWSWLSETARTPPHSLQAICKTALVEMPAEFACFIFACLMHDFLETILSIVPALIPEAGNAAGCSGVEGLCVFQQIVPTSWERSGPLLTVLVTSAGDAVGVLHLMELPRNLRKRHPQEIKSLNALVDREVERLDMLACMAPLRRQMAKVGLTATHNCCIVPSPGVRLVCDGPQMMNAHTDPISMKRCP